MVRTVLFDSAHITDKSAAHPVAHNSRLLFRFSLLLQRPIEIEKKGDTSNLLCMSTNLNLGTRELSTQKPLHSETTHEEKQALQDPDILRKMPSHITREDEIQDNEGIIDDSWISDMEAARLFRRLKFDALGIKPREERPLIL